jgi:hypothetical protein
LASATGAISAAGRDGFISKKRRLGVLTDRLYRELIRSGPQLLVSRDGRFQNLVGFRRVDESLYEHTPVFVAITVDWTSLRTKSVTEISIRLAPRPIFRFRSGVIGY